MTRTHRRTTDERLYAAAQEVFTAEGAPAAPAAADDLERRMKALLVSFDRVQYLDNGLGHHPVSDAMAYGNLMLSRPAQFDKGNAFLAPPAFSPPTQDHRTRLPTPGIDMVARACRFEGFRYGQPSDAVACAMQSHAAAHRPDPA